MSSPIKNVSEKHHLQKRGESGSSITSSKKYKKFAEEQKKTNGKFFNSSCEEKISKTWEKVAFSH
jgi:hypothetical protein